VLPRTPYPLLFIYLVYLLFVYDFVFGLALSRELLNLFPLSSSLQTQKVKIFSSNHFEEFELVGFALQLECSKL